MDDEHGIFLQDFLDLVYVFQKVFLPNLETIKQAVDYRSFRQYDKPDIVAYQRLIQAVITNEPFLGGHCVSKAAIHYLDINLHYFYYLRPPFKKVYIGRKKPLSHPNCINLEGYSVPFERSQNALDLLCDLLSVDEKLNLRYDCEMICRNYFAVFRIK